MSEAASNTVLAGGEGRTSGAAIARSAFHLVLGQVATTALAIVFSAALGRHLGAVDFGVFYLITTTMTFAYVVVEWGQSQYVVREAARHPARAGALLGNALVLRAAGAAPVSAAALAIGWALGYDGRTLGLLALLLAAWLPFFLSQGYGSVFRARERMDLDAAVQVLFKALSLAFALAALGLGGGVAGVVLAQGAAGLVALGLAAVEARHIKVPPSRPSVAASLDLLRGGTPILAIGLAITVQPYLDAILLSRLVPPEPVGWYGAARNIMGTLVAPATILGTAAYPRLSRVASDVGQLRHELRTALRPLLGVGALAGVGTYLFADLAIGVIYGNRGFGPAGAILKYFSPALFLVCIDVLLGSAILAVGKPKTLAIFKAVNVAACTALALVLVPIFQARTGNGGVGLVVAFGASEVIMFAAATWILPRGTLDRGFAADFLRSLAAGALVLGLFRVLPPIPPLLGVPLCILAFAGAAAAFGLVRRAEIHALVAAVQRRRGVGPNGLPKSEMRDG